MLIVVVLATGWAVESREIAMWGLVILISVKTLVDVLSHYWEHWSFTKRPDTTGLKKKGTLFTMNGREFS